MASRFVSFSSGASTGGGPYVVEDTRRTERVSRAKGGGRLHTPTTNSRLAIFARLGP